MAKIIIEIEDIDGMVAISSKTDSDMPENEKDMTMAQVLTVHALATLASLTKTGYLKGSDGKVYKFSKGDSEENEEDDEEIYNN